MAYSYPTSNTDRHRVPAQEQPEQYNTWSAPITPSTHPELHTLGHEFHQYHVTRYTESVVGQLYYPPNVPSDRRSAPLNYVPAPLPRPPPYVPSSASWFSYRSMSSHQLQVPSSLPLLSDGWIGSRFNRAASHRDESSPEHPTQSHSTLAPLHPGLPATTALPGSARSSLDMLSVWEVRSAASIPIRSSVDSSCPINTLPPEVLSQIFLGATGSTQLRDAKPSPKSVSLRLSHVCRYWRGVAIDLPGLWQCLSLTGCKDKRTHRRLDLVNAFMERTKGLGMVIYYQDVEALIVSSDYWRVVIRGEGITVASDEDRCYCVLDTVISKIGKIRRLELVLGHASSCRLSLVLSPAAAMLETLSVRYLEGGARTHALSSFYASLPRIRHLVYGSYLRSCAVPLPVGVPWVQLITLHVVDCPMAQDTFLDILDQGECIEEATVRLTGAANLSELSRKREVVQHALKELTIYGDEAIDAVFISLQLPSLHSLDLRSDAREAPTWPFTDIQALHHLLSGIRGGLDDFMIFPANSIVEEDLISILALPQMSTLKHMYVRLSTISDAFFARLHPDYGFPLVPHLEKLTLAKCTTTDGVVSGMILSRLRLGYPLRYADIAFNRQERGLHPQDLAQFTSLRALGVAVDGCF